MRTGFIVAGGRHCPVEQNGSDNGRSSYDYRPDTRTVAVPVSATALGWIYANVNGTPSDDSRAAAR